jgi:hypothetical protein
MTEEERAIAASMPPHARLTRLRFDASKPALHLTTEDAADEHIVTPPQLQALHAARVRAEAPVEREGPESFVESVLTASTWPRSLRPHIRRIAPPEEELHFVLALRIADLEALWYFVADSFNFRDSLGNEARYTTELNLRALARRLASFAPQAAQDAGFATLILRAPLPAPLSSLVEFFRTCARC